MLALILYLRFLDSNRILKLVLSLCCSLYFAFRLHLLQNGLKKCPECYGNELCRFIQNHQIQLTWFSWFLYIINPNLTKSVFYGIFNSTEVVIKRKVGRIVEEEHFNDVELVTDKVENFVLCPSVRDIQFLLNQVEGGTAKKKLWLDLRTSIEPLLLMYFQTLGNWPVPEYHGACGDLIVEGYKGEPLSNFLFSDLRKRIFLASQLLEMANLFTFGHSDFAFYFTDYSIDNLVVDSSGKIFLIDLDNVIISNKTAFEENNTLKRTIHSSEILDDHQYAFSPSDICQYYLSDHNYFSVCKYLLSHPEDGLLRHTSPGIKGNQRLVGLLEECSQPKLTDNRFSAGQNLQNFLKQIIYDYKFS